MGLIMDVTELKIREKRIQAQAQERQQLVANEASAMAASRLKSQFLANVGSSSVGDGNTLIVLSDVSRNSHSHNGCCGDG